MGYCGFVFWFSKDNGLELDRLWEGVGGLCPTAFGSLSSRRISRSTHPGQGFLANTPLP
jgi:hypothetical protein